nr:hypothetical protein [Tanacetum cinerariifolium]
MRIDFQDMLHELGEVNPVHAYYNDSRTSKDNEDPCWSTSFKTKRTQKTSSALKALWKTLFVLYLYLIGTLKLWEYKQALIDSNPGTTYRLDVEDTSAGKTYFKRMYICFKGLRDGWLASYRKVIGIDGCVLKHTYRGEVLTAMRMDTNNQMYHIAWDVVSAENAEN